MADCIFCKIAAGDIPAEVVYEDDDVVAFRDINPQAPTHVQVIPRRHIERVTDLRPADDALMAKMMHAALTVVESEGLMPAGFRLVWNCGPNAGQAVLHIHLHVLGGRALGWPPG